MKNVKELPVIFVRDLVVFPGMSVTVTVGREISRLAVIESQKQFNNSILTITQLRAEDPDIKDLDTVYRVGTICKIERAVELTDGGMQVQLEGVERFSSNALKWRDGFALISGEVLKDTDGYDDPECEEVLESLSSYQPVNFDMTAWSERKSPEELKSINEKTNKRQLILEEFSVDRRIQLLKESLKDEG